MRCAMCQINTIVGNLQHNLRLIKKHCELAAKNKADLIIFPELCISGYLAEDLFLHKSFLDSCQATLEEFVKWSIKIKSAILIGLPLQENGKTYNCAFLIHQGSILATVYKRNLPNYGVFDEQRVFASSNNQKIIKFKNKNLGIFICEDIWTDDVPSKLATNNTDLFIVMNCSPFDVTKNKMRQKITKNLVKKYKVPLLYVNQVGGQDDLVFDGGSFAIDASQNMVLSPQQWQEGIFFVNFNNGQLFTEFSPVEDNLEDMQNVYQAVMLGTRDYILKNNFKKVLLGASGGIDSALVAVIAADAIGPSNVRLVRLPSQYSSDHSLKDAEIIAKNLKTILTTIPINTSFDCILEAFKWEFKGKKQDVTEENLQARIRGVLLMALSNKYNELLLTTGNKSEYACGYATLYGDMCGGFAPIKDVYKTTVYKLAEWRNANIPLTSKLRKTNVIPTSSINKAPSAELKPGQFDQDTLPPYEQLDKILFELIENDLSFSEVVSKGFAKDVVVNIAKLIKINEYKRRQSALGVKVSSRKLGKDRRYPVTNHFL